MGVMRDRIRQAASHSRPVRLARRLTGDDVRPFVEAITANPEDAAPHLVFADYLEENGDPRHAIIRQHVARGDHERFGPTYLDAYASQNWHWPSASNNSFLASNNSFSAIDPYVYMYLVQHRERPVWLVRYDPHMGQARRISYYGVFGHNEATEIARHQGIHVPGLTDTHPQDHPEQLSRAGQPVRMERRLTDDEVRPFVEAIAANPEDDAAHLVFADYLEENGDPRHAIIRQHVAGGHHRTEDMESERTPFESPYDANRWDWSRYTSNLRSNIDHDVFMSLVPHDETSEWMVRYNPSVTVHPNGRRLNYVAIHGPAKAAELARYQDIHVPGLTDTQPQPEQLARAGQPVRMSRSDIAGLHARVADNPHDRAAWGVLADALDEAGKPHTARAFRDLALHGKERKDWAGRVLKQLDNENRDLGHTTMLAEGHVLGIPVLLANHVGGWNLEAFDHLAATNPSEMVSAMHLDREHGVGLLHEMEPVEGDTTKRLTNMKDEFPLTEGAGNSRLDLARTGPPMRMERRLTAEDAQPFVDAIAANPTDDAPHLALADHMKAMGDPRHAIIRAYVDRGIHRTGHLRSEQIPFNPPHDTNGWDWTRSANNSDSNIDPHAFMYLVPHRERPEWLIRYNPTLRVNSHDQFLNYQTIHGPAEAAEIARYQGIHVPGLTDTEPQTSPQQLARPGRPVQTPLQMPRMI